ncbi:MAG: phenylalanine--tRNA ligase subunit beta, partial [bacterium]|nr:phenylalanine--tRNA ligase subunit beta [bacterium]
VAVMPNRGDCLSVIGMAREVGALTGLALKLPRVGANLVFALLKKGRSQGSPLQIKNLAKKESPRYTCALIEGVKATPSPVWMRERLEKAGLRSINTLVDFTNYILLEWGQPLHAFDAEKIRGGEIIVRKAKRGERLQTLDKTTCELSAEDLVIADAEGPIAIGGVMGGLDSGVTETTRSILLESAFFQPAAVRRTTRRLGIHTDSSYRFERGVDFSSVFRALEGAVDLLKKLQPEARVIGSWDLKEKEEKKKIITLSREKVNQLLGETYSEVEIKKGLTRLSFVLQGKKGVWKVTVPSYRTDVTCAADLVEEVARFYGYERIAPTVPSLKLTERPPNPSRVYEKTVRDLLAHNGLLEAVHYSFTSPAVIKRLGSQFLENGIELQNPLNQDLSLLRPLLAPQLLQTAALNQSRQNNNLRFFECGTAFSLKNGKKNETKKIAGLLSGDSLFCSWQNEGRKNDFFAVKGIVESILSLFVDLNNPKIVFRKSVEPFLHPGQSADLFLGNEKIGFLGALHPLQVKSWELTEEPFLFELDFDRLVAQAPQEFPYKKVSFRELDKFPWVERDICLVLDGSLEAEEVRRQLWRPDLPIREVSLFDLYCGEKIEAGKKSLAYRIRYQRPDRTLTDEEVVRFHQEVTRHVQSVFGAMIR